MRDALVEACLTNDLFRLCVPSSDRVSQRNQDYRQKLLNSPIFPFRGMIYVMCLDMRTSSQLMHECILGNIELSSRRFIMWKSG